MRKLNKYIDKREFSLISYMVKTSFLVGEYRSNVNNVEWSRAQQEGCHDLMSLGRRAEEQAQRIARSWNRED